MPTAHKSGITFINRAIYCKKGKKMGLTAHFYHLLVSDDNPIAYIYLYYFTW